MLLLECKVNRAFSKMYWRREEVAGSGKLCLVIPASDPGRELQGFQGLLELNDYNWLKHKSGNLGAWVLDITSMREDLEELCSTLHPSFVGLLQVSPDFTKDAIQFTVG